VPDPRALIEAEFGDLGQFELLEGRRRSGAEPQPAASQDAAEEGAAGESERPNEAAYDIENGFIPPWVWINQPSGSRAARQIG